ncbi:MAG: substrate-binding domain-containing protein [Spirochaetales bacterium]|nr:substrate-binding domain-containing protein [Spirochaetales bacterium]
MNIALALAEIDKGSAVHLWPSVAAMFPKTGKDRLFIFPGGIYDNPTDFEYLRNTVYSYVTPMNIDAAIIWTSSMTNPHDADTVTEKFSAIRNIPHVTISGKNSIEPDCTDIAFDAYSGMKKVIAHCIEEHDSRRLAFLRGPETHSSAQERYQAYRDALSEHGIGFDPLIVSDPSPWESGVAAIRQLVFERHLMPGVDFDTLVCSSDLLMLEAGRELLTMGINIPRDVKLCGFNDSPEAKLLGIPCTTVRTPFNEIGRSAIKKLRDIISTDTNHQDVIIKTIPIYRRSCGCGVMDEIRQFRTEADLYRYLSDVSGLPAEELSELIMNAIRSGKDSYIRDLVQKLSDCMDDEFSVTNILQIISSQKFFNPEQRISFSQKALMDVVYQRGKKFFMADYTRSQFTAKINNLRYDLFRANSPRIINSILKHKLKSIGILGSDLVLFNKNGTSTLIGSESSKGEESKDEIYSSATLLPQAKMDSLEGGVYIMEPLFTENEVFGYLILHTENYDGTTCEEVRVCVSSVVKNCLLLEETNKTKQTVEDEEQKRVAFFDKVGSKVKEPLVELERMIDSINVPDNQRELVSTKVRSAKEILDSVLISSGSMDLKITASPLSEPLSSIDSKFKNIPLPILNIDEKLLTKALQAITRIIQINKGTPDVSVIIGTTGANLVIRNISGSELKTIEETSEILFAKAVFFAHGGTLSFEGGNYTAFIPYPNMADVAVQYREPDTLLCLGSKPGQVPTQLKVVVIENAEDLIRRTMLGYIRDNSCLLYIDNSKQDLRMADFIHEIENSPILSSLPVLCIGTVKASSLSAALHLSIDNTDGSILYIGQFSAAFKDKISRRQSIHCTLEEAPEVMAESRISAIVLDMPDTLSDSLCTYIEELRRNRQKNTPIIIFAEKIDSDMADSFSEIPNVILYNRCFMDYDECFFRILVVSYETSIFPPLTGAIVKKAQAFLNRYSLDQISRWQIASEVHVSEDYLTNIFKKELGVSPWDYLIALRIDYGYHLLLTTGIPISEVARRSGFHDSSYFSRVFKKLKGISPTRIRNSQ